MSIKSVSEKGEMRLVPLTVLPTETFIPSIILSFMTFKAKCIRHLHFTTRKQISTSPRYLKYKLLTCQIYDAVVHFFKPMLKKKQFEEKGQEPAKCLEKLVSNPWLRLHH